MPLDPTNPLASRPLLSPLAQIERGLKLIGPDSPHARAGLSMLNPGAGILERFDKHRAALAILETQRGLGLTPLTAPAWTAREYASVLSPLTRSFLDQLRAINAGNVSAPVLTTIVAELGRIVLEPEDGPDDADDTILDRLMALPVRIRWKLFGELLAAISAVSAAIEQIRQEDILPNSLQGSMAAIGAVIILMVSLAEHLPSQRLTTGEFDNE